MVTQYALAYRAILRDIRKSATVTSRSAPRNVSLQASIRSIIESYRQADQPKEQANDIHNVVTFLRSQREHKALLQRYNPLFDLTAQERIHATARRVGLDLPVTHNPKSQ